MAIQHQTAAHNGGVGVGDGDNDQPSRSTSDGNVSFSNDTSSNFRRTLSSKFSFSRGLSFSTSSSSSSASSSMWSSSRNLLKRSSLRKSLRRLDSSHRLAVCSSGSDLSQLYLSSPEQDATNVIISSSDDNHVVAHGSSSGGGSGGRSSNRRRSWLQSADLYGRRKSFKRHNSYAEFLNVDIMSDIDEAEDEEKMLLLIEETTDDDDNDDTSSSTMDTIELHEHKKDTRTAKSSASTRRRERRRLYCQWIFSPTIIVPTMMIIDLILGVSLSLYDSNLLRNVPGFNFPLCYALVQKLTNALASLVLICLSRKWEMDAAIVAKQQQIQMMKQKKSYAPTKETSNIDRVHLTALPSGHAFCQHIIPLSAVALVQTISSAFANEALTIIPLPLFKVCLMCGPIFVAFITSCIEGQLYSKGRMFALSLIGIGACRAVYAESEDADNPRYIMMGAGYALAASAFSGIGLVLSSVLMHRDGGGNNNGQDDEVDSDDEESAAGSLAKNKAEQKEELNPLSLLFYLSCEQVLMLSGYLFPWDTILLQPENEGEEAIVEQGEFEAFLIYFAQNPWAALYYLMMGSMMSLCLAVLTFVLVNRTSPVATSLLGNVRSIPTVAISSVVFDNTSTGGSAAFGYALTLAGGVVYALAALG